MALPNEVTYKRGVRDSADEISQGKPLNISNKIWQYNRNKNKFLAWVLRNGAKTPIFNHVFGHNEASPLANWVTYTGADETSQGDDTLTLATGHGARVTLGSRIFWPRTKEIMRIDATFAADIIGAVTRNYGRGVSTNYLLTGDKGLLLAPSFEQGFTTGSGITSSKVHKSFTTSEVSWPVQVTNIENAERARGGNPFKRALGDSWDQSKGQMENELIFSGQYTDASFSPHPISASEGLDNFITTNDYSATKISRMDLWDILAEWGMEGGAIVCGKAFKNMVAMWSMEKMTQSQESQKDGINIKQILTPSGLFDLIPVDLLDEEPNLMGSVFFVPKGKINYCPLTDGGMNLDIKYNPINRDEVHSKEGEIYGVYGWEFFEEETFAKLSGLQFAA